MSRNINGDNRNGLLSRHNAAAEYAFRYRQVGCRFLGSGQVLCKTVGDYSSLVEAFWPDLR